MKPKPEISVVMSVYNGAAHLRESIDGILNQVGVDLELIVVNDGSTDESGKILDEYAKRDGRIRVIHQENKGLTQALIRGCAEARGEYIARHDAGDISLPDRLEKQIEWMQLHSGAAFVSCGTRFVGPRGEHLYDVIQRNDDASTRLLTTELSKIRGVSHHGSGMFSKKLYDQVGGYRPEFYFAQDLDLWIRLAEHGTPIVMPQILYQASLTTSAISNLHRKEQIRTGQIIIECAKLRRSGRSEDLALKKARAIRPISERHPNRFDRARAFYFIGSCLKKNGDPRSEYYLKQALMKFPLHLKSVVRLLLG